MMITVARYSRYVCFTFTLYIIHACAFFKKSKLQHLSAIIKKKIYFRRSYNKSRTRNELHGEMLKKKKKKATYNSRLAAACEYII